MSNSKSATFQSWQAHVIVMMVTIKQIKSYKAGLDSRDCSIEFVPVNSPIKQINQVDPEIFHKRHSGAGKKERRI